MHKKSNKIKESQDFFPKNAQNPKAKGFIFNQAPLNKKDAAQQVKEQRSDSKSQFSKQQKKRSAFIAKLYQDDDDLENEMKYFNLESGETEQKDQEMKGGEDKGDKLKNIKKLRERGESTKVGRLKFSKGSLGMFAIHDIHENYLIVNYTRNAKGYVSLENVSKELKSQLEIGQFIICSVTGEGSYQYSQNSGNQNKKLQLSIDLSIVNKSINSSNIVQNMILQGVVHSKEAKGYLIDFGMSDQTKGFLTFSQENAHLQLNQLVLVQMKPGSERTKIVKCEMLGKSNINNCVPATEDYTLHTIKPGYLVNAKVSTVYDNGVQVSLLGGVTGTIFIDHLFKQGDKKFKNGEKLQARIIAVDPISKNINLTMLPHLLKLKSTREDLQLQGIQVGKVFDNSIVHSVVYGNSYEVKLPNGVSGFLHKIHTASQDQKKDKEEEEEEVLEQGQTIGKVIIKEINYFDGKAILSMKQDLLKSTHIDYTSINAGDILQATILEVNEKEKSVIVGVNDFVKGKLHLEHMADHPLKVIPPKFKTTGKQIKVMVWNVEPENRLVEFTKKDTFLKREDNKIPLYQSYKEVKKGDKIVGIVVSENEFGYIIKSFAGIKGLITFAEIKQNGKKIKQEYSLGSIVKGYVLFKKKDQGMALTLNKKVAKELKEKETEALLNESENKLDNYLPNEKLIEDIKKRYKAFMKNSSNKENVGKKFNMRIVESQDKFFILKSVSQNKKLENVIAILPKIAIEVKDVQEESESTIECLVYDFLEGIPVASTQKENFSYFENFPQSIQDIQAKNGSYILGMIDQVNKKGVSLRFTNGLKKFISKKYIDDEQYENTYQIGQIKRVDISSSGYLKLKKDSSILDNIKVPRKKSFIDLSEGSPVTGLINYKKGPCVFITLPQIEGQILIGRLHILECESINEFNNLKVGDRIVAKILQVFQSKKKTWIELTRKKEHMKNPVGLNTECLKSTIKSFEDLKNNQTYQAYVSEVCIKNSSPILIYISPFVKGSIHFSQIVQSESLESKEVEEIVQSYKQGDIIDVHYNNGKFSIIKDSENKDSQSNLKKGDLVIARFVKSVAGKGVAVQVTENVFGFIEVCEITDEICAQVSNILAKKLLFKARVIDFDKNSKPMLSTRESILNDQKWKAICPSGKTISFQKQDQKLQSQGNWRNKIYKFGAKASLSKGDVCLGYITNIGKSGCFIQIGHNCVGRASLNELSDEQTFDYLTRLPIGMLVVGRIVKIEEKGEQNRYHLSLKRSSVVFGTDAIDRSSIKAGQQVEAIVLKVLDFGKLYGQIKGSYLKMKIKNVNNKEKIEEGEIVVANITEANKQKIKGEFVSRQDKANQNDEESQRIESIYQSVKEEQLKEIKNNLEKQQNQKEIDVEMLEEESNKEDEIDRQIKDIKDLEQIIEQDNDQMDIVDPNDSDADEIKKIIKESKYYEDNEDKDEEEEEEEDEEEDDEEENDDEEMNGNSEENDSDEESKEQDTKKKTSGKQSLKKNIQEEQKVRKIEQSIGEGKDQPKSIDDFERMLFQNKDQSYIWIQYIAFMIENAGIESARKIAERAVKGVSIVNEDDKMNLWIAYINLENTYGTQEQLISIVKRALEVNDKKKVYLHLINIYKSSQKFEYIEDIYKLLCKKYNTSLKIWSSYLEFLFELRSLKQNKSAPEHFIVSEIQHSDPKQILQRALQSLTQTKHINIISKFGMLEFKYGAPENGRTMFEGIVNNYPKRMDIWSIYMDMEVKYGGENKQQARHLFERCLSNQFISSKPKKMKLVFQKYMEFEATSGNKKNVEKLRQRVEEYLDKAYGKGEEVSDDNQE